MYITTRNGAQAEDFAEIARTNHEHSQRNPYSQFQDVYTLTQITESPTIDAPLTKLQCCPTSDGGAAAVVVSQAFLDKRPKLKSQAILIAGQAMGSDPASTFTKATPADLVGAGITRGIIKIALAEARCTISDVKVCELHDCFSAAEMVFIDALGLSAPGKAHEFIRAGHHTYGPYAKTVVNPSGGLISKGHPLGATGLAQCAELAWHLRGWANNRLVDVPAGAVALAHNLGLGGAGVVTVYSRADRQSNTSVDSASVAAATGLGYNPAVEAKGFTRAQADSVRSKVSRSEWALGDTHTRVEARF